MQHKGNEAIEFGVIPESEIGNDGYFYSGIGMNVCRSLLNPACWLRIIEGVCTAATKGSSLTSSVKTYLGQWSEISFCYERAWMLKQRLLLQL